MLVKKSFVLKSVDGSSRKAIITLECDGYETSGKVRLYNFPNEPLGIISLGIFCNGKVEKAGLTRAQNMLYTFGCDLKKLPENFSCAVVNFNQGEILPLLYGDSQGSNDREEIFDNVIMALNGKTRAQEVEEILEKHGIEYEDSFKQEIEKEIDNCLGKCENCKYKEFYFSQQNIANKLNLENAESPENAEEKIDLENKKENNFYCEIKNQINDLFEKNPSEKSLEKMLPNSKWVKVKVDDNGNYYVIGLIYEQEHLKYICYGVPGVFQEIPPRHLAGFPTWFPLDQAEPENFGYWLSYQDADSGESVKAVVI